MNDEQIKLIRQSFGRVASEALAESFYNHLFSIQPALRLLFPDELSEQKEKLARLFESAIELLAEPEKLVPFLEAAGRRHALHGARADHYETGGAALLAALRETDAGLTAEEEAVWTKLYEEMSGAMKRGAQGLAEPVEQNQDNKTQENSMNVLKQAKIITGFIFLLFIFPAAAFAQTTAFTYQGKLNDGGAAANGAYLLEFKLFDTSGTQIGATVSDVPATVLNGIFTVQLDFGANAFTGANRLLEISVRRNTGESYVTLTPRQPVTSAPYAIKSKTADAAVTATTATTAINADMLDGIDSSGFMPANTTAFVRNQTSPQTADFNVSGTGTANILNATTQINVSGLRVLAATNVANTFVGWGAGALNTTGVYNTFVGNGAGLGNLNGSDNSIFGANAGQLNSTGVSNSFFGRSAGSVNTGGNRNSIFGANAGRENTTGSDNSFYGYFAGRENTTGEGNAFFGLSSGLFNTVGSHNSVFGRNAGQNNTAGSWNAFFGANAGLENIVGVGNSVFGSNAGRVNTTGNNNTIIGYNADFNATNLNYATAIGSESRVSTSNTIALGRTNGADTVLAYGRIQVNTLGAAGATTLCRNASNQISTCSSSLRYKTNIKAFDSGLSIVNRLKPITFDWKDGGMKDLGLGAEDVAAVEENLVIRNAQGEVEGVKYDRLGVVLVNAVREQQSQIDAQRKLIDEQAKQIELLKQLVCAQNAEAGICKGEKQ